MNIPLDSVRPTDISITDKSPTAQEYADELMARNIQKLEFVQMQRNIEKICKEEHVQYIQNFPPLSSHLSPLNKRHM